METCTIKQPKAPVAWLYLHAQGDWHHLYLTCRPLRVPVTPPNRVCWTLSTRPSGIPGSLLVLQLRYGGAPKSWADSLMKKGGLLITRLPYRRKPDNSTATWLAPCWLQKGATRRPRALRTAATRRCWSAEKTTSPPSRWTGRSRRTPSPTRCVCVRLWGTRWFHRFLGGGALWADSWPALMLIWV